MAPVSSTKLNSSACYNKRVVDRIKRHTRKTFVGILGGIVVLIGIVLIPYPGPGWLIVFGGLALLSTEFHFARRLLDRVRGVYDRWTETVQRQHGIVRVGLLLLAGLVVGVTIWLVNGFGITASILDIRVDWLTSPFFT